MSMEVAWQDEKLKLVLETGELRLLRRALERASYLDTPAADQAHIQVFCETLLEALEKPENKV